MRKKRKFLGPVQSLMVSKTLKALKSINFAHQM